MTQVSAAAAPAADFGDRRAAAQDRGDDDAGQGFAAALSRASGAATPVRAAATDADDSTRAARDRRTETKAAAVDLSAALAMAQAAAGAVPTPPPALSGGAGTRPDDPEAEDAAPAHGETAGTPAPAAGRTSRAMPPAPSLAGKAAASPPATAVATPPVPATAGAAAAQVPAPSRTSRADTAAPAALPAGTPLPRPIGPGRVSSGPRPVTAAGGARAASAAGSASPGETLDQPSTGAVRRVTAVAALDLGAAGLATVSTGATAGRESAAPSATSQVLQLIQSMLPEGADATASGEAPQPRAATPDEAAAPASSATPSTVTLELNPQNLGRVTVTVRLRNSALDVRIAVTSRDTLSLLSADRHLLTTALGAAPEALDLAYAPSAETAAAFSGAPDADAGAADTGGRGDRPSDPTIAKATDNDQRSAATRRTSSARGDGLYL